MPLQKNSLIYLVCLIAFLALDFAWLGLVAQPFYARQLGTLLSEEVVWPAAIAFYLMFMTGLIVFCITPALRSRSAVKAGALGGFYGFITYATYELTNLALITNWPAALVPVDIGWGIVLCTLVSLIGYGVGRKLHPETESTNTRNAGGLDARP